MIKTDNPDLSSVFKGFSMLGKKMTAINQGLINVSDKQNGSPSEN